MRSINIRNTITGDDLDLSHLELNLDYVIYDNRELIDTALSNIGIYNDSDRAKIMREKKHNPLSILKSLYVEDDERDQGLGTCMMDIYLADLLKHNACSVLVANLTSATDGFDLLSFYEKNGYKVIGNDNKTFPIMLRESPTKPTHTTKR